MAIPVWQQDVKGLTRSRMQPDTTGFMTVENASQNLYRFGHWLSVCTLQIHLLAYLLT